MSKSKKGNNPAPYIAEVKPENEQLRIPPDKYAIAVAPLDVTKNPMKLTGVDTYTFKEMPDGMVYRISKSGVEYPPITKEQFEEIKKLHEQYLGNKEVAISKAQAVAQKNLKKASSSGKNNEDRG